MGSTNGVQPSWRLATITMQTIPSTSCPQRAPPDATSRMSAALDVVMTAPFLLQAGLEASPSAGDGTCNRSFASGQQRFAEAARDRSPYCFLLLSGESGVAPAVLCIVASFSAASQYRCQPGTVAAMLMSFHLG